MITRLTLPGEIEGCYNGSFSPLSPDNGIETVMNGFGDLKQVLVSSVVSSRVLYVCMYVCMDGWMDGSKLRGGTHWSRLVVLFSSHTISSPRISALSYTLTLIRRGAGSHMAVSNKNS